MYDITERMGEKACWSKWLWKQEAIARLKTKGTVHNHCSIVGEIISHRCMS